jgi:Glycosyl hydrolase family 26
VRPGRSFGYREYPTANLAQGISRKDFLRLGGVGLAGAVLPTTLPGIVGSMKITSANAATRTVALGAFAPSLPWSFDDIDKFENLVGGMPAIIHWFQDWKMDFNSRYLDSAVARGGMPLISWEPWKFGGRVDQRRYALMTIVDGKHNDYIRQWAQAAAAWGKPFFLRFAHEMNGDWTSWSPGVNGNKSREFVSAWRRVHSIFQRQGAKNVRWVWAPVAHYEGATPYEDVYPGDEYVDWVGISGYNWGDTQPWSQWQSFLKIFNQSYNMLGALTSKPIMIPEVASTELGGNKAAWIRRAFFEEIPNMFPRIRAVVWFHADKEQDWRVNSSNSSLEVYREVVASARYQSRLLGG